MSKQDNQAALEAAAKAVVDYSYGIAEENEGAPIRNGIFKYFADWTPPPQPEPLKLASAIARKCGPDDIGTFAVVEQAADAVLREHFGKWRRWLEDYPVGHKDILVVHCPALLNGDPPPGGGA